MFNTEIIHFLQQFDSPIIYWFMAFISALGIIPVVLFIVLGITFAVDFKKGLVLINVVAWTALLTFVVKQQVDFPRPIDVDASVNDTYFEETGRDLADFQPKQFLEIFSPEILGKTRIDEWERFGFPSGHTSVQIALWVSLIFLFRKRWIWLVGISIILLTMISRLYLGHHFLGDVLGGFGIGILITSMLLLLVKKTKYLNQISYKSSSFAILWIPALALPFVNYVPIWLLGSLIGVNTAAILIILLKNFPVFHVLLWKRITAALITLVLIFAAFYLTISFDYSQIAIVELLINSIINFCIVTGSIYLSNYLNLIRFRF